LNLSSNYTDYTYNIRSWLTGINDINNCSTQAGENLANAFSMRMTLIKSTPMGKDPISSVILFYVFSVPGIIILYLFFGLTTQAGAQIPLLIIGLSALWLPIIGLILCLY
jgi:hypothetical protein